ncbi:MAG: aminotransferase class V-fold PLP-dependent enzyme [Rhodothalassiaceae bacterium]
MPILPPQRDRFDLPRDLCYLNAAYMTPFPTAFSRIAEQALAGHLRPWEVTPADFFSTSERVRSLAARILDSAADAVALVPAVSYAVATAARNLPLARGEIILTLAEEFPSNYYGWQCLAAEREAAVVLLDGPPERDWTAALLEAIECHGERIGLVAIPHVHWSSGVVLDLGAIRAATREVGAALFLDLTQSLGALPVSMREIDPDFAVAAGYKWLFGPYALGYLHVAARWRNGRPLEENWIARAGSEDFSRLVHYADDYQPGARRFDMGERSNFLLMPFAEAGLGLVLEWGVEAIARSLATLNSRLIAMLEGAGFIATPAARRSPHLIAVRHPEIPAQAIARHWHDAGIRVSVRGSWIRIAPHLWVDAADEDRFGAAVAALEQMDS